MQQMAKVPIGYHRMDDFEVEDVRPLVGPVDDMAVCFGVERIAIETNVSDLVHRLVARGFSGPYKGEGVLKEISPTLTDLMIS